MVDELNSEFKKQIVSPFTVTLGDEFQGVMRDAQNIFLMFHKIQSYFKGVSFRFALSVGTISTQINRKSAIGMDGPGFHSTRTAMEQNKKQKRNLSFMGNQPEVPLLDNLLKWIDFTTTKWKHEKWKTIFLNQLGMNQKEIEKEISISQSAISQNLRSQSTILVLETEKIIEQYLAKLIAR
jgi:hypothetical protein